MKRLNKVEKEWFEKIFSINFFKKEILIDQINCSSIIERIVFENTIIIRFDKSMSKMCYPSSVVVPIEMVASQDNNGPIIFMLFLKEGFIDELEIFTADGLPLNPYSISLTNIKYILNVDQNGNLV